MFGITPAQFGSALRSVLTFGGGYVLAKGWFDAVTLEAIIGALVAVGTALWGMSLHTDTAKLDSAAKVLADPARVEKADPIAVANVAAAVKK